MIQSEMMEMRRVVHGFVFFFFIPLSSTFPIQPLVLSSFRSQSLEFCFFSLHFSSLFVAGHHTLAIYIHTSSAFATGHTWYETA